MVLWDKKAKEKGEKAELKFQEWLDKHKIYYLYLKQDIESFPIIFEKDKLKRPDFIVLLPNIGFIMVDVKRRGIISKYNDIPIDLLELEKYIHFQRKFQIPMWYAFSNEILNYETWFWIPISRIIEINPPRYTSSKSKEDYLPINLNEFVQIKSEDSLAKIFSKSF